MALAYNFYMHPPSRTRRIFKWTGAGLLVLMVVAWVRSITQILAFSGTARFDEIRQVSAEGGLVVCLVWLPTRWLWHRDRQSQRIRPGCCPRCGYDLTGNTSGVCSECGEPKPPPATV